MALNVNRAGWAATVWIALHAYIIYSALCLSPLFDYKSSVAIPLLIILAVLAPIIPIAPFIAFAPVAIWDVILIKRLIAERKLTRACLLAATAAAAGTIMCAPPNWLFQSVPPALFEISKDALSPIARLSSPQLVRKELDDRRMNGTSGSDMCYTAIFYAGKLNSVNTLRERNIERAIRVAPGYLLIYYCE